MTSSDTSGPVLDDDGPAPTSPVLRIEHAIDALDTGCSRAEVRADLDALHGDFAPCADAL